MNIFFPQPVQTYTCLTSHYNACEAVQKLLSTNHVQFQVASCDNPHDSYSLIHSRTRVIKHRLQKIIQTIQYKYREQIHQLSQDQKQITLQQMKNYIIENQIDHLKYMDLQENWVEDRVDRISQMMSNYDNFLSIKNKIEQQLDCQRTKIEVCKQGHLIQQFVVISGICQNTNIQILQRLIFRKSRGYSITFFRSRQRNMQASVFLCFMNKNIHKHIGEKIVKACQCNDVCFYELPNQIKNMEQHQQKLMGDLKQAHQMLQVSGTQLTRVLSQCIVNQGDSLVRHLLRISYLQRLIYIISHSKKVGSHTLLTFHAPQNMALPDMPAPSVPIPSKKPRTMMPSMSCLEQANMLTELFSTPKHNQLVPSIFIFATVPVLFGIMFSDFGHGIILLVFANMFNLKPIFHFMAFMSIYCGIIYNQFFGMKILRLGSYGIIDPIWAISENGLNFQNSLKMKISMIIAFVHMGFGMIIKIINQRRRGEYQTIMYDSLPKIGLLFTTVGYLDFLIIAKWLTTYSTSQISTSPSIINSVLELYLGWNQKRNHSILGSMQTQKYAGSILLYLDFFFVSIMVYNHTIRHRLQNMWSNLSRSTKRPKKYSSKTLQSKGYKQIQNQNGHQLDDYQQSLQAAYGINEQLEKHITRSIQSLDQQKQVVEVQSQSNAHSQSELGPLQVFQFLLSLISATTSYLRLFALSLAHAKLSALILDMLLGTLANQHPTVSYLRCAIFTIVTIAMMLALDVMECMMHVVRLHWVQWMGRFYQGGGHIFKPEKQWALQ